MLNADAVATADDGPAPCAAAGASGSAHGRPGPAAFNGLASLARGARWWEAGPHIAPPWPPRLLWWRRPPRGSQRARDFAGAWWEPRSRIHGTARHPNGPPVAASIVPAELLQDAAAVPIAHRWWEVDPFRLGRGAPLA